MRNRQTSTPTLWTDVHARDIKPGMRVRLSHEDVSFVVDHVDTDSRLGYVRLSNPVIGVTVRPYRRLLVRERVPTAA